MAPALGARIERVVPQVLSGHAPGAPPLQWPPLSTKVGPNRHAHIVGHAIAEQALQTALLLDDVTDEAPDPLRLLIGIELVIAGGSPDIAPRGMLEPCTAPCLVAHPCQQAAFPAGAFRFAQHPPPPSPSAIVVVGRIREPIGLGHEGPNNRPTLQALLPILIGACPATHCQPENQPPRVHADLRQHALKAPTGHPTLAALALIFSTDDHAVSRPPHATARSTKAYGLAVDATGSPTGWGWAWRTDTIATRRRCSSWSVDAPPPTPPGGKAGSVIEPLLLLRKAVPGDDTSPDLAQTPPLLRGQRGPERWQPHLLGARGVGGTERHRRGGAWSSVPLRPLLAARRADVATTGTASPKPLHAS
jgi:hypothetical protein